MQQCIHDLVVRLADLQVVVEQLFTREQPLRAETFARIDKWNVPRRRNHPWAGPDHDAPATCGDDSREEHVTDVQSARGTLFEHVESAPGEDVFDVERSPGENGLDHEEARGALAGLLDEFAVQLGSGFNFVAEEMQRERFGRPPVWQRVLGGIRYEIEHKERIEGGSKLLGALNVIRHVVPQKELVPGFVEEFASELLSGVGEQSRYESAFGGTQPNPQVIFDILDAKAAVLELPAAAAGTRIVATDRRHRCPVSRVSVRRLGPASLAVAPAPRGRQVQLEPRALGSPDTSVSPSVHAEEPKVPPGEVPVDLRQSPPFDRVQSVLRNGQGH